MSASGLQNENVCLGRENASNNSKMRKSASSRQSLKAKFDREYKLNRDLKSERMSRTNCTGWCDALSLSMPTVNARQAWKNSTEKFTQTLNHVRSTIGTLSQKITKSTKKRQPLINLDSPQTPVTPYTRSKVLLGRTPTKLYSPFYIDTPKQKENLTRRHIDKKKSPTKGTLTSLKKRFRKTEKDSSKEKTNAGFLPSETKLSNDLLQAQLGIYEFQSVARRIVQKENN